MQRNEKNSTNFKKNDDFSTFLCVFYKNKSYF